MTSDRTRRAALWLLTTGVALLAAFAAFRVAPTDHDEGSCSPPDGLDGDMGQFLSGGQVETAVAIDPSDEKHVVGVAMDLGTGAPLPVTRWFTSFDSGETWATGLFQPETGHVSTYDPAVVITPNGIPVVAVIEGGSSGPPGVFAIRSLDGGRTWQSAVLVDSHSGLDKVQAAVDRSSGPHHGQVALTWMHGFSGPIYVGVSDDDGASFHDVQQVNDVPNDLHAPDVAYGPASELWVTWCDWTKLEIGVDKSTDGGVTFGTDVIAATYTHVPNPIPGSGFNIHDVMCIAADWTTGPYSGYVYVLYHRWHTAAPQNADVFCLRSKDDGATWQKFDVNKGDTTNADQFMPFAQVDPHGNVDVAFFDRRLDPKNQLIWTWAARSSDGGRTWAEHAASDVGWNPSATDSPSFIGHYLGLDVSEHTVRPFFTDGRTGSLEIMTDELHLDLYTASDYLFASTGGTIDFTLNVGPNHAGQKYWLLGSFATDPGLDFGTVHLPLADDALFLLTLQATNSVMLQHSMGTLDSSGSAAIALDTLGPFDPSLAWTDIYFAALVWDADPTYATNATTVSLRS